MIFSFKKNTVLFWILKRVKGQKRYLVLSILGNILFACTIILFSIECKKIIDGATAMDMIVVKSHTIVLLSIILVRLLLQVGVNCINEYTKAKLINKIRQDTLQQLMKKEYKVLQSYHSGELVNRMFSDAQIVVDGILGILPPIANMSTRLIGAIIVLISLDKLFTTLFLVAGCGTFLITRFFRKQIKGLHKRVQEEEGRVHSLLQETLENIRFIKASELENRMERKVEKFQRQHFQVQMKRRFYSVAANAGMGFIFQMGYLYALVWGAVQISSNAMSYGTLTAILQLVSQIQAPFSSMSGILQRFYGMLSSAERLEELFVLKDEELEKVSSAYKSVEEIEIKNVSFAYDQLDVLKNIDVTIKAGEFVAITGLSGGGKSTLFSLLLGIYQPNEGQVRFHFEEGTEVAGKNTRRLFSYVPQGNTLFSGSIRENMTLFCVEATEEAIWEAAEIACIKELLEELPQGLDTVIGERGMGVSEGQAQRIAVARAILGGAPIILLDESTSALDESTEKKVLKNMSLMKEKTWIIITHKQAALSYCDRHLHLNNGRMEEI